MLFDNKYTTTTNSCDKREEIALQDLKKNIKEALYGTKEMEVSMTKKQILVLVAKVWASDPSNFLKSTNFFDYVFEAGFLKLWVSKQDFKNLFREHCLTKRRNELIIGGITSTTASSYLQWLVKPSAGFKFGQFDINLLGEQPQFTKQMDLELLTAIKKQEGLFMSDTFIDWNVQWSENLLIHEEHLKWRFRHFSGNWTKLICFFSFDCLIEQMALKEFRENVYNHNGKEVVPVKSAMEWIMKPSTKFNAMSYLSWIQLAVKNNCAKNCLLLKSMCENYVLSRPLHFVNGVSSSFRSLLMTSSATLEDVDQKMTIVVPFLFNYDFPTTFDPVALSNKENSKDKSPIDDQTFFIKSRTALIEVFPLLVGKNSAKIFNLDLFHARIFELAKLWESNSDKIKVQKSFKLLETKYKTRYPTKRRTPLSKNDIEIMIDSNKPQDLLSHFETEEVSLVEKRSENISSFAKRFCWRQISEGEWQRILSVILKLDLITKLKDNKKIWEFILNKSKVSTGKQPEEISALFFKQILPHVNNFLSDIDAQRYFLQK